MKSEQQQQDTVMHSARSFTEHFSYKQSFLDYT